MYEYPVKSFLAAMQEQCLMLSKRITYDGILGLGLVFNYFSIICHIILSFYIYPVVFSTYLHLTNIHKCVVHKPVLVSLIKHYIISNAGLIRGLYWKQSGRFSL